MSDSSVNTGTLKTATTVCAIKMDLFVADNLNVTPLENVSPVTSETLRCQLMDVVRWQNVELNLVRVPNVNSKSHAVITMKIS